MDKQLRKKVITVSTTALFLIVADQVLKHWVRDNIAYGSDIEIASWFKLCFVENPGAAFGMQICPKQALTIFRICAVCLLSFGIFKALKKGMPLAFATGLACVTAGAFGNVIDCVLFARIYDGGDLFLGKVVDMLYFPLVNTTWPDWAPWAGQRLIFFRPVFNLADAAITCGMFYLAIFHMSRLGDFFDLGLDYLKRKALAIAGKKVADNTEKDKNADNENNP